MIEEVEVAQFIFAVERILGAVFPPQKEPLRRYAAAVNILAELECKGYQVTKRPVR